MNAQARNNEPSTSEPTYPTEPRGAVNDAINNSIAHSRINPIGTSPKRRGRGL